MLAAARCASARKALASSVRASHTLVVPEIHEPVTTFEAGVPTTKVRELQPLEKSWNMWATSQAFFAPHNPAMNGLVHVPAGESWVTKNKKVLSSGWHFCLPFVDCVKSVKSAHPIAMGVNAPNVKTNDGSVDVYAVVYVKITDAVKSAFYTDAAGRTDSELAVAFIIQRILADQAAAGASKDAMAAAVTKELAAKESELGLKLEAVEIRGVFPSSLGVPDKIRALEQPMRAPDAAGHGLAADYWQESLTPPFFESQKFGSRYEAVTPAAVSLEWSIPSPPDYHHFNEVPKLVVSEDAKH